MSQENDNVVRLRGLPWTTGSEDVIQFLEGSKTITNHRLSPLCHFLSLIQVISKHFIPL